MTVDVHQMHMYSYHTHLPINWLLIGQQIYQSWQLIYTKCTGTATIHTYTKHTESWQLIYTKCTRHKYHTHLHWAYRDSWYTQNAQAQIPYTLTLSIPRQLIYTKCTGTNTIHTYTEHTETVDIHKMHKAQIPYTLTPSIPRQLIYTKCTGTDTIHTYTEHTETVDIHKMHRHRYHTHLHRAYRDSWYTQNAQAQLPYTLTPSILSNQQASQLNNQLISFTGTAARHSE